ncbi:MAG: rhomboid family intramembrane serine protease [Hormoscilla sp. GM102CHS1]|nr:rhomboid family intramembrane serine protease [Hormoscilla sp. GM102CHS1]
MSNSGTKAIASELKTQATILGGLVAIFWIVEIIDQIFFSKGMGLAVYGILPRNPMGLRGILFGPFLHGNFPHLIANTIPFLTLGWFIMLQETSDFLIVTVITAIVSGLGVWLFGSPGFHIGASGVIFGYLGFLLLRGYFERSFAAIFFSVVVAFFYGSLIAGVLPEQVGISWEGHLFGLIGGVLAAKLMARRQKYR